MSKPRSARVGDVFPTRKQDDGTYLCSVCGGPMQRPTFKRYCGSACREIAYVTTDPAFARRKVWQRDKGVCAECGCDTSKIARIMRWAEKFGVPTWYYSEGIVTITRLLRQMGFKTNHLWEMDHIEPVVEGGGLCGLENLRTLCVPCHRLDTKELAGRRASMKRTMPLFASASKSAQKAGKR